MATINLSFANLVIANYTQKQVNSEWNEAQFNSESRLKFGTELVSELNFTPGNPFNCNLGLIVEF